MKSIKYTFIVIIIFLTQSIYSQDNSKFYLVEFEKFSLPIKDIIRDFEEDKAAPFMASDIYGNEKYLGDYKGKKVLLWFWSTSDGLSISQIAMLNDIQASFRDELHIVSFGMEEKAELVAFRKANPIDFPIIPKSKMFADLAYAGD